MSSSGEFFHFSRKERKGIISLMMIILLLVLLDFFLDYFIPEHKTQRDSKFKKEILAFESSLKTKDINKTEAFNHYTPEEKGNNKVAELFFFDPNTATRYELARLGLSDKQINTLKKYLTKGGEFYKKEDLKKIYGIGESTYNRLKDYIDIEKKQDNKPVISRKNTLQDQPIEILKKVKIDLNEADTSQLILLKGIGSIYAGRICKYRELLGGYVSIDQLTEVYGLPEMTVSNMEDKVKIDSLNIQRINVNKAEFKDIIKHPYIDKYQTQAILKYREIKGSISDLNELSVNNIFTIEELRKLKPYLSCKK